MTPTTISPVTQASDPPSGDPMFEAVRKILVECLACEPHEVTPSVRFHDLEPDESIEFLDFTFRVERAFQIQRPFDRYLNTKRWRFDEHGRITRESQEWLTAEWGVLGLPAPDFEKMRSIKDLLTVKFFTAAIRHAVAERDRQATALPSARPSPVD
jgi:acyl carrier protein